MKNNAYLIFTKATIGTMFILIKEMVKISPLKVELNPADFIRYAKSKANLRISESFREKIQRHAKVISVKEAISFRSQDLKESAYDSEIIGDLDNKYWYLDDWDPDRIGAWYAGPRVFSRH